LVFKSAFRNYIRHSFYSIPLCFVLLVLSKEAFSNGLFSKPGVLFVASESYMSYTGCGRGYKSDLVYSIPWMTIGVNYGSFERPGLPVVEFSEATCYTAFGAEVVPDQKLMFGLGFREVRTNLGPFSEAVDVWEFSNPRKHSGFQAVVLAIGTYDIETSWDPNSQIWGLIKVGIGSLSPDKIFDPEVKILAGIRLWKSLSISQSIDFEYATSLDEKSHSSFGRLGWGFGLALVW
jgi:hypothetical protein